MMEWLGACVFSAVGIWVLLAAIVWRRAPLRTGERCKVIGGSYVGCTAHVRISPLGELVEVDIVLMSRYGSGTGIVYLQRRHLRRALPWE